MLICLTNEVEYMLKHITFGKSHIILTCVNNLTPLEEGCSIYFYELNEG